MGGQDINLAIEAFVRGFPDFLLHGAVTLAMIALGCVFHVLMTPMKEMKLIREGNVAAGVALAAVIIGLALPLSASLVSALSLADLVIWGVVALLLQMLAFRVADLLLRDLPRRIENNEIGAAIVLAAVKISAALVMAAALYDPHMAGL
jgi:putative membrane protein